MSYLKKWHFRIDAIKQYIGESINVIQQDTYSNKFVINCLSNGYPIDLTDLSYASVVFAKSDTFNVVATADVVDAEEGRLEVLVDYQALTALGICNVGIKLFFNDSSIVTLNNFPINVVLDPYAGTDGDIVSTSEYPILLTLIDDVTLLETNVSDAEALRVIAENAREVSEDTRESQEVSRVNAESSRVTEEGLRVTAENARVVAEGSREDAEVIREANEDVRQQFEFVGDYNAATQYLVNNIVRFNGASYACIQDSLGNLPTDGSYFKLVAEDGNGNGDMTKATYDQDNNGVVDDSEKLGGQLPAYYAKTSDQEAIDLRLTDIETESLTAFTTSASIASLPVGTLEGKASGLSAEGLTLVNSFEKGDFSDGTTGLVSYGASLSVVNNKLTVLGDGTASTPRYGKLIGKGVTSDKWFVYSKQRVTNADCVQLFLVIKEPVVSGADAATPLALSTPLINTDYELYKTFNIFSSANTENLYASVIHQYADAATANGKVMEVDGNAGVHAINLTALGLEALTEAQLLDLVRSGYIDGIQGVYRPKVESVGKNKFDGQLESGLYNLTTGVKTTSTTSVRSINKFKVKPNTSYRLSGAEIGVARVIFYDYQGSFISSVTSNSITTPSNCYEVAFYVVSTNVNQLIQLEEGTVATAYEPHQSSKLTADTTIHRLPNGVKDRIYEADGEVWKDKQIEEYVLQSANITAYLSGVNVDRISISKPLDFIYYNISASGTETTFKFESFERGNFGGGDWDNVANENKISSTGSATLFYLVVPKGIYSDITTAQTGLIEEKAIYQLATPQLINLTEQGLVDGELFSFEDGTVYNSSDTFHAQNVSFDVPSNRGAQIDSLLESAQTQAKAIDSKASKVQEDWIDLTLLSGWTGYLKYRKTEFGNLEIYSAVTAGTAGAGTVVGTLAEGYRPIVTNVINASNRSDGTIESGGLIVNTSGNISVGATTFSTGHLLHFSTVITGV